MKFFADTANIEAIKEVNDLGILDGVTTNPSLMAKEGIKGNENIFAHYKEIARICGTGHVSAEVISTDFKGIMDEAVKLAKIADNIIVKVPMIKDGVKAIKALHLEGIKTNCTLIFSPVQAILAARAGASYVSPFMGRLDDIAQEGIVLIQQLVTIFSNYGFECEVLAASIRSTLHITQCAEIGADVVTCPPNVIMQMLNHPLTDIGLAKFLADHQKVNG
jgi:transaldolase